MARGHRDVGWVSTIHQLRWWDSGRRIPNGARPPRCRLGMNNPPTAWVGFGEKDSEWSAAAESRLSMNDPPTGLVGFGRETSKLEMRAFILHAEVLKLS